MTQPTRRAFCLAASAALLELRADAQSRSSTHPNVAAIDHDGILASAATALTTTVTPITTLAAPRSPGTPHDFYSEPDDSGTSGAAARFTAHRDALYVLGVTIAALTAASVISPDPRYAARAAEHLRAWFLAPATRMNPTLQLAHREGNAPTGRPEGVLDGLPLAEIARSLRLLAGSEALTPEEFAALRKWFADYATWLNDSRTAGLARDMRDHHASSWLLQAAACADANVIGLTSDDPALNILRHRFRTVTLRAQIVALGYFPREVATPNPFRNSLLNLDLLTLACELLTTRFDNPWEFELQDGPGLRNAIAWHFPFMLAPAKWPYPADSAYFTQLPGRRVSLLLAGRAYSRPEYVDLWRSLAPPPATAPPELLRSFPVSQPLLWFTRPKPPSV
jgi:hypothetical protein